MSKGKTLQIILHELHPTNKNPILRPERNKSRHLINPASEPETKPAINAFPYWY